MDLGTELVFCLLTDWKDYVFGEVVVDFLFVVVDCDLWILEMLDFVQHVKWISQSHQEIVHLVKSVLILDNFLEEESEKTTMPV